MNDGNMKGIAVRSMATGVHLHFPVGLRSQNISFHIDQWIGLRENVQERPI